MRKITWMVVSLVVFGWAGAGSAQTGQPAKRLTSSQVTDHFVTFLEEQLIETADAMPADTYAFAPTAGAFKGVRTFGQQVKHHLELRHLYFAREPDFEPMKGEHHHDAAHQ